MLSEEPMSEHQAPIGYMVPSGGGYAVLCPACDANLKHVRQHPAVYHVNVYPYAAHCLKCGVVLVEPRSSQWPELFDGK